jgi:hypothetical protein
MNGGIMGEKWSIKFSLTITTSTDIVRNFFTCRKAATWERRLYFPSEGRRVEDFFARKIRRFRPQTRVPEASTLIARPPLALGSSEGHIHALYALLSSKDFSVPILKTTADIYMKESRKIPSIARN